MKRFSIGTLMAVVLVCGVAVAALRDASDSWAGVMLALTLFMLGIALLGILTLRGDRRAFWQGFALFGWGYLVLTMGPWFAGEIQPRLPTTHFLGYAFGRLHAERWTLDKSAVLTWKRGMGATAFPAQSGNVDSVGTSTATILVTDFDASAGKGFAFIAVGGNLDQFVRVGHCLFALSVGLVGGLIARWFQRTGRETAA